ncbi:MAG TPA: hypothetical protein PKK90_07700 [Anaerolineaceae bacterium]|nr:hypothetical protein [Anaerolineaceae bacterium]
MASTTSDYHNSLITNSDPALKFFALRKLSTEDGSNEALTAAASELTTSPIVNALTQVHADIHPYHKWCGAHWSLVSLAELGFPFAHPSLPIVKEQVYTWLLSAKHLSHIHSIDGRTRRCASQEGNAIFSSVRLNMVDERTEMLVGKLLAWQWPDGGWNCDKHPEAANSSFWETWSPLRALLAWRGYAGSNSALDLAIDRAAEVFLSRQLFIGIHSGQVMNPDFLRLRHPSYWTYDVLVGLELMEAAGKLADPRCKPALAWLESRPLVSGGFPTEVKLFQATNPQGWHYSPVNWGSPSKTKPSPWLTIRAVSLLRKAGRLP